MGDSSQAYALLEDMLGGGCTSYRLSDAHHRGPNALV